MKIEYQNRFGKFYRRRVLITISHPKKYCQKWFINRKMFYFTLPLLKAEIAENGKLRRKTRKRFS